MALALQTFAAIDRQSVSPSSKILPVDDVKRPLLRPIKGNATGRRGLLNLVLLSVATVTTDATDSKIALLQEYMKRSKKNKAKNDKERLDDYYKRNYKDYFELVEGSTQGKKEELLSESEKAIREWLQKNKK